MVDYKAIFNVAPLEAVLYPMIAIGLVAMVLVVIASLIKE